MTTCPHTKIYVTDSTMRRNQVPCPWCKDAEIAQLREEADESDHVRGKMSDLLRAVAAALKGEPDPNTLHSWHDLPELAAAAVAPVARPKSEYHEDDGPVLWWRFPIVEPPYVGTPSDCSWDEHELEDYYTHWTPIPLPEIPT